MGAALVELTHAQLLYREGKFEGARMMAGKAEPALLMSGSWQRLLLARWLRAEADRALGNLALARELLEQTLQRQKRTDSRRSPSVVLARSARSP